MIGLVDGNNLGWRFLFSGDRSVGYAVKVLLDLVSKFSLDNLIVVWDGGIDTRRTIFGDYKLGRDLDVETKEKLLDFISSLKNILGFCGFVQCYVDGNEADDVIYNLISKVFVDEDILICSNDKDFYSLLSNRVKIWNWDELLSDKWFLNEYGIAPADWLKVRSLSGDHSDNIPGVSGIGIKKALDIVKSGKYDEYTSRDDVKLYFKLLNFLDIDLDLLEKSLIVKEFNRFKIMQLFEFCKIDYSYYTSLLNFCRKSRVRSLKLSYFLSGIENCKKCDLSKYANNVVSYKGDLSSNILVIGEAPGEEEDLAGVPFVGRAGSILDGWLEKIGLKVGDEYRCIISNTVWCRPVKNGKNCPPSTKQIEVCSKNGISRLINYFLPEVIICLGKIASDFVLSRKDVNVVRESGKFGIVNGFGFDFSAWVLPHPASLLYGNSYGRLIEDLLERIKKEIK